MHLLLTLIDHPHHGLFIAYLNFNPLLMIAPLYIILLFCLLTNLGKVLGVADVEGVGNSFFFVGTMNSRPLVEGWDNKQ